ncbi:MAG: hypothetical protein U1A25_00525 [Candidatus Sungbacteria bacterium]|nr:hypothetical protein [bacterium]MDZ4260129.1 hypothetical protein [Candidatus Sungbacteria bacterium]
MVLTRTTAFDLNGYAGVINQNSPKAVATWLIANAQTMSEDMFSNPANDWGGLNPEHLLALRAVAPAGVFTSQALVGYLSAVRGDEELTELAPALFGSDVELISKLPAVHTSMKPQLIMLMQVAYEQRIRLADPRLPSV